MSKINYCPRPKNKMLTSKEIDDLLSKRFRESNFDELEITKVKKPKCEYNRK